MLRSTLIFSLLLSTPLYASNYDDCVRKKIKAIELENAISERHYIYGYRTRSSMKKALRSIETTLWKQCRRYSSKLRDVYQQHM